MSLNLIYMPAAALNGRKCLDASSLLLRVIGETNDEASIAEHIKNDWRPRGAYRINKVNRQSFKIGLYEKCDFERLRGKSGGT